MKELKPAAIYLCPGDPWNAPRGGQTAFAKQALNAFGSRFAIVSPRDGTNIPIGKWFVDKWQERPILHFNIGSYAPKNKGRLPLVPRRIVYRKIIQKYLQDIRELGVANLFLDSPELLGIVKKYDWNSVCYRFAGLSNPVEYSRYQYLRFLAKWFHHNMMSDLADLHPDALLASADKETISKFEESNQKYLLDSHLSFFPTRFDPDVFYPGNSLEEQKFLGWENNYPRLIIVGRLCWIKGWQLALDSLAILKKSFPKILLVFVGDGEDRRIVEKKVLELGLANNVLLEGFLPPEQVRRRLIASELWLSTSIKEGWSVAAVEALACGKTMVSTEVSGAKDMIKNGYNGFIVSCRDPIVYSNNIIEALKLVDKFNVNEESLRTAELFSLKYFAKDWAKQWDPLFFEDNDSLR